MNTTAVFVELLVIGIQTSLWVAVLVAAFEPSFLTAVDLSKLEKWEGLVTAGAFAICYSFGIIVDRLADVLFLVARPSKLLLRGSWAKKIQAGISAKQMNITPLELALKDGNGSEYFSYFRVRIRITRALALNSLLSTAACILYGILQIGEGRERIVFILSVFIIGGGVSLFSYLATGVLDIAHETRKKELEHLLRIADKAKGKEENV
jgi:hypothetical protein